MIESPINVFSFSVLLIYLVNGDVNSFSVRFGIEF